MTEKKEFHYRFQIRASDLWQVRMYYAYASYLAVVNITCIVASVVLIAALWQTSSGWFRGIMLAFVSLFTIVQPLVIYLNCLAQAKQNEEELDLTFHDKGLTIRILGEKEKHPWTDIVNVSVKPTLVIVYTDASHGYILTNRVLGDTRKDFLAFLKEHRSSAAQGGSSPQKEE